MSLRHSSSHWIALVALAVSGATHGADGFPTLANDAWYRVEVVIFERLDDASPTQEILVTHAQRAFPRDVLAFDDEMTRALAYVLDAQSRESTPSPVVAESPRTPPVQPPVPPTAAGRAAAAIAEYESQLQLRSYRFEPNLLLSAQAGRLQRGNGYRVVFHRAWIQPVPDRDQLVPMLIQTGDRVASGWRIEGTLGVTRGRYLHLDTRLWYAADSNGAPTATAPAQLPGAAIDSRMTEMQMTDASAENGTQYMQLYEQRRMRSGELHYLDHPKFGVLARVDPVVPPDALVAELARLGAPAPAIAPPPQR